MTEDLSTLTTEQLRALLHERAGDIFAELGRRAVPPEDRIDRACEACGAPMTGVTTRRRACSAACRVRLHYWREKAKTDPGVAHRLRLEQKGYLPASRRVRRPGDPPAGDG